MKLYVATMEALRKNERQDETQFTTKNERQDETQFTTKNERQDETQFTTKNERQDETQFTTNFDGFFSALNANVLFLQVLFFCIVTLL